MAEQSKLSDKDLQAKENIMEWYTVSSNWIPADGNEINYEELLRASSKMDAIKKHFANINGSGLCEEYLKMFSVSEQSRYAGIRPRLSETTNFVF